MSLEKITDQYLKFHLTLLVKVQHGCDWLLEHSILARAENQLEKKASLKAQLMGIARVCVHTPIMFRTDDLIKTQEKKNKNERK